VRFLALEKLCHSYQHTDEPSLSLKYCSDALEISQTADIYCLRAEAYIANSMFDEGIELRLYILHVQLVVVIITSNVSVYLHSYKANLCNSFYLSLKVFFFFCKNSIGSYQLPLIGLIFISEPFGLPTF